MDSSDKFWFGFWAIAAVFLCVASVCGKGCNDSDNRLYQAAVDKGCSVIDREHTGHSIVCPGYVPHSAE